MTVKSECRRIFKNGAKFKCRQKKSLASPLTTHHSSCHMSTIDHRLEDIDSSQHRQPMAPM
eukprot:scaffold16390_cov13-Cyclotella_meneghiniana.AAC.1